MSLPDGSRSLLLPGPQPPLSHFGATLLKHTVTAALRYALHSLGAPMPEGAPVRIVALRLYLDRLKLRETLGDSPSSGELLAALLEPGGSGSLPAGPDPMRGAVVFHRTRLRLRFTRRPKRPPRLGAETSPTAIWETFRATVSAYQPVLNDALLGEILGSLERRAARHGGRRLDRCQSHQAFALATGARTDLASLGVADPLVDSWSAFPEAEELVSARLSELPDARSAGRPHPLRGRFREVYRKGLDPIRAAYLKLASDARERGLIEEVGDAFFIPFDLSRDLAADSAPAWLPQAVTANRAEYHRLLEAGCPPESIRQGAAELSPPNRDQWILGPFWPLD